MDISYGIAVDDDRQALFEGARHAFGGDRSYDPDAPTAANDRVQVARVGDRPVGRVATLGFDQWFNGAGIPMAGVTGVMVEPHMAGRGIAKRLLEMSLHDTHERREPIASLFPTTASLYRSVGFEIAGGWGTRAFPMADLRTDVPADISVDPAEVDILANEHAVYDTAAGKANGWLGRSELWNARIVFAYRATAEKNHLKCYRAVRDGNTIAIGVIATTKPPAYPHRLYDFRADELWGDPLGVRAIGAVLAGHSTTAGELQVHLARHQLDALTEQPQHARVVEEWPWMTRIVDLPAALAARPTPIFDGTIALNVNDPLLAHNDGPWALSHNGTSITADRDGPGTIAISIQDLAAVYTGFQTPAHLAGSGRLVGAGDDDIRRLTDAFRASEPWLVDFF